MLDLIQKGYLELQVDYISSSIYTQFTSVFKHSFRLSTMSRARKWWSKRPALVKHSLLEKCQHFDWIQKGEKTQYNLRNFWLFNPKSEELLISLLCPKVFHFICNHCSHSTTNTHRLFTLEMIHFYFFIFSLFFESWRKCGWTLCSKTSRSNWTSPLSTFSNISVHSIWTSMTTTGFFVSLDWNSFMTTKIEKKEEVPWWLCTRNPLLEKILKACGKQIKTLIYNVFADYRSIVDCHNIIARWGSI